MQHDIWCPKCGKVKVQPISDKIECPSCGLKGNLYEEYWFDELLIDFSWNE